MIKKFITIKNVGRFKDYNCSGDVEFKKMNIIYGENGAGKTTLVTIFRSLRDNNSNILIGRKTLGSGGEQQILILTESESQIKFNKDGWDKELKNIEIFDNAYVTENVHSGNYVDIEHKRKLHLWAIGEEGVTLANRIAEIDNETRDLSSNIILVESKLKAIISGNLSVVDFIQLRKDGEIDNKIREQEIVLESNKNFAFIKAQPLLDETEQYKLPIDQVKEVLDKSYSDITLKINQKVKNHITNRLDEDGEDWIEKGLDYLKDEECPFCTQDLKNIDLVDYYKKFFNEAYKDYKKNIIEGIEELKKNINDKNLVLLKSRIKLNEERLASWNNILKTENKTTNIDFDNYERATKELIKLISDLFERKLGNPIEPLNLTVLETAHNSFNEYGNKLEQYNREVLTINSAVQLFMDKLIGDTETEQKKLDHLRNTKKRNEESIINLVDEWQKYHAQKDELNTEKSELKEKLNTITNIVLDKYSVGINKYLSNCGANFKLSNSKVKYTGGKACLDYKIQLNHTSIDLGKTDSPDEIPSFKNTLSEGDKSALAFAFFLAKIEKDPDISKKVVVIDDPISSMDVHRKDTTAYALYKISQQALQALIFTHSPEFAKLIWDKDIASNKKCLRTEIENGNCKLIGWDIDRFGMSDYFHHYFLLSEFFTSGRGDKKSIAQSIRLLLEGNLRFRFPKSFVNDQWLGNYIELIRESESSNEIHILFDELQELEEINDYSKKFHHDHPNGIENLSNINTISLKAYSERALKFCTG